MDVEEREDEGGGSEAEETERSRVSELAVGRSLSLVVAAVGEMRNLLKIRRHFEVRLVRE
jgi:hypothetical protein